MNFNKETPSITMFGTKETSFGLGAVLRLIRNTDGIAIRAGIEGDRRDEDSK